MNRLAYLVQFQDSSALMTVLTQISCLGGKLLHVAANEKRAQIAVNVPDQAVRHFALRLRQIIGVIELVELEESIIDEAMSQDSWPVPCQALDCDSFRLAAANR